MKKKLCFAFVLSLTIFGCSTSENNSLSSTVSSEDSSLSSSNQKNESTLSSQITNSSTSSQQEIQSINGLSSNKRQSGLSFIEGTVGKEPITHESIDYSFEDIDYSQYYLYELNEDQNSYTIVGILSQLEEYVIPEQYNGKPITSISLASDNTFEGLKYIYNAKKVQFGKNIQSIYETVIKYIYCPIYFKGTIDEYVQIKTPTNVKATFDGGCLYTYLLDNKWEKQDKDIVISDGIEINLEMLHTIPKIENVFYKGTIDEWCDYSYSSGLGTKHFDLNILDKKDNKYVTIEKIEFGDNIVSIGISTFSGNKSLTYVKFGKNTTKIGDYAFYFVFSLKEIHMETSVIESIGDNAFYSCNLNYIFFNSSLKTIGIFAFKGSSYGSSVTINGIQNTKYNIKGLLDLSYTCIETIGEYAFYGNSNITSIVLPKTIKHIGDSAFYNSQIKSIDIPEGVNYIGNYAFGTYLTKIVLPSSLEHLGSFEGYTTDKNEKKWRGLEELVLPDGLKYFGGLYRQPFIKELIIPDSVLTLGQLWGCYALEKVQFSKNLECLERYITDNPKLILTEFRYPEKQKNIEMFSFDETTKKIYIPKSVEYIRFFLFFYFDSQEIIFEDTTSKWRVINEKTKQTIEEVSFSDSDSFKQFAKEHKSADPIYHIEKIIE